MQQYGDRLPGELPPSLDLEADSDAAIGLTAAQALAWAERAWTALVARYGTCIVYTSLRVWLEVFGGLPSKMGASALWLKIPYVRNYHEAPALDWTNGINGQSMPRPWQTASPGVWIVQFQGDAWDVTTGRREQVDVDQLAACAAGEYSPRVRWLQARLGVTTVDGSFGPITQRALMGFQVAHDLTGTGVVDVATLAALL